MQKIFKKILKGNIHTSPNYNIITKLLKIIKQYISEYIKYRYRLNQIGGPPEKNC